MQALTCTGRLLTCVVFSAGHIVCTGIRGWTAFWGWTEVWGCLNVCVCIVGGREGGRGLLSSFQCKCVR